MSSFGWCMLLKLAKMGCICSRETIEINSTKYSILDLIDGGGFSSVYLVEEIRTKKQYALKKMVCHGEEDEKICMKEIEYHNLLKHPYILPCIDFKLSEKGSEPSSSSATDGTLDNALKMREKEKKYMPVLELLNLFVQICNIVRVFHCARPTPLAHRDIKPSNILLNCDGRPVIIDLGSTSPAIIFIKTSVEARNLQDYASSRCTITYRAPELFHVEVNGLIDQRTDIWSLGCLLYALCFFKSPFDYIHEKGDSVALATVSGKINFPTHSPYPEFLHELILSLLKVNPEERPFIDEVKSKALGAISKLESASVV